MREEAKKCDEHWYTSEEDLAKYGDCPYNHDDKGEVKLNQYEDR